MNASIAAQKMKLSIKDFFSKCDEVLNKSLMETSFFVQWIMEGTDEAHCRSYK